MILEPSLNFSQKSVCNICMSYPKQIFLAPLIVMSVKSGREVQQDWTVLLTHVIFFLMITGETTVKVSSKR